MSRRIVTSLAVVLFTGALGSMLATCGRPASASTAAGPGLAPSMAPAEQLRSESCASWSIVRRATAATQPKHSNVWWNSTTGSLGSGLHRRTNPRPSRFVARCDPEVTQLPGGSARGLVE